VRCVPVRQSRCRAVVLTVLTVSGCRRGRVVLDWQGPGRWRLDPRVAAAGWLQGRIGHHVFIPPAVTSGAQSPTALVGCRMSPIVVLNPPWWWGPTMVNNWVWRSH